MEIRTERLVLKPLGPEFLESTCEYSLDIENTRYMMYLPDESAEETKRFLTAVEQEWKKEKPKFFEFAVTLNDKHIGAVSIDFFDDFQSGELGWIIAKDYWRKGYAYEASKAVVETCRKTMNVKKFFAHCDSENIASMSVMKKLGMHLVEQYGGRKNRASDEMREECRFEVCYE